VIILISTEMVFVFVAGWNADIKWVKLEEAESLSKAK